MNPVHHAYNAVETHSCVDDSTDKRFLRKTQLNDKSTAERSKLKVFVNYRMVSTVSCTQLTRTFGPKCPAVDLSFTCVLHKIRLSVEPSI